MEKQDQKLEDWQVVCRNIKCKHHYDIPSDWPLEWKVRKFRGVCGHGEDTAFPELLKPVKCPECGEKSYRVIRRYFQSKTDNLCSI
ncbi:hypothetical protein [Methanobacterium sp.]|uniref:hypothetical protein n=1 Tax=Methanobacterium sp. TaxID=2164 RepID=UPI0025D39AA1|nr:hypothetical protein [Methanobacterium sp.]MBI5459871.1 hypothetical protein [Methanobacterium sp.]